MEITNDIVDMFNDYLINTEKSKSTIYKYVNDVRRLQQWLEDEDLCKQNILTYKTILCKKYATSSVNTTLSALNAFFSFIERQDLRVKKISVQRQIFISSDIELLKGEYEMLLKVAKENKKDRLFLLMQTICCTGIRVSELCFITIEAISDGVARINCKGKKRDVFIPQELCEVLHKYANDKKIKNGPVFITKNGNPLNRSNIWSDMKKLCKCTNVLKEKVFPHNLRHLFARTHYDMCKDIVRLADVLGHSSINTTRIYTLESGETHRKQIQSLGLLKC